MVRARELTTPLVALIAALALLPAGIAHAATVTTTNDGGPGSLRQAIADAAPGETIVLPAGTYSLTQGELPIGKDLTISGHGPGDTVISGGGSSRVFHVTRGRAVVEVTISGVAIRDGVVRGGEADGGGVHVQVGTALTLRDVVVANNLADGSIATGGGISSDEGGALKLLDSKVLFNVARGAPGAAGVAGGGVLSTGVTLIERSIFEGNIADAGGGTQASGGAISAISGSITNTTIAANAARALGGVESTGGGINGGGTLTLSGDTLSSNAVEGPGRGGNVDADGPGMTIENTIVSGGVGPAGSENCAGPLSSQGFNLDSRDQCGFHAPGDQVNTDPLLGPLADNGGPTQTMALSPGSPAVDRGSAFGLASDQRGMLRPSDFPSVPNPAGGDGSDIGAFELQAPNPIHPIQKIQTIHLGKLKRNKKKGTAKLLVTVSPPDPGTISLSGKGLKRASMRVAGNGTLKLAVIGNRRVKRALRLHGRRKVTLKVIYAPTGNSAVSQSRNVKLIRKVEGR
jgi:hypothetical protein